MWPSWPMESDGAETISCDVPAPPGPTGWRLHLRAQANLTVIVQVGSVGDRELVDLAPPGTTTLTDVPVPLEATRLLVLTSGAGRCWAWLTPGPATTLFQS